MGRKERRGLRRKLGQVEWEIWDMEVMFSGGGAPAVYPYGRKQRDSLRKAIEQDESRELEIKAERYGVEIPVRPEWFTTEIIMIDFATVPEGADSITEKWLNETGRTMVAKQISEARFAYWKGWADVLIPILALIVAALALFKDIIVEVLKTKV